MADLDRAIAALRDWNSRRGQISGSLASLRKHDAEGAKHARTILAALDAARGEAVAWQYRHSPEHEWRLVPANSARVLRGDGDEYRPLYTATPTQVAEGYVTLASAEALALEAMRIGNIAGHNRTVEGCWSEAVGFRFEEFMADEGEAILVPKVNK